MKIAFILSLLIHGSLYFALKDKLSDKEVKTIQVSYDFKKSNSIRITFKEIKQTKKLKKKAVTPKEKILPQKTEEEIVPDKSVLASYLKEVIYLVEKNKKYPSRAKFLKQEGIVELKVKINQDGTLEDVDILNSKTSPLLISSAVKLVKSIKSYPSFPESLKLNEININLPIHYRLR